MSNFFSKYLGKIALTAAVVLWTGCNDVDKNSENEIVTETSINFQTVKSTDFIKSSEKSENSSDAVKLDSAQLLEEKRARDSLMNVFFPVGLPGNVCVDNVYAGLRYDIGHLLKFGSVKKYECIRKIKLFPKRDVYFLNVPEEYGLIPHPHFEDLVHPISTTFEFRTLGKVNAKMLDGMGNYYGVAQTFNPDLFVLKYSEKVQIKKVVIEKSSALKKDDVAKVVRRRISELRLVYHRFLQKDSVDVFEGKIFGGEIVLKLTIAADGSIKVVEKISSNTSKKLFDEEIIKAVGRWKFGHVKIGNTIATISLVFSKK